MTQLTIEYRGLFNEGPASIYTVTARNINSGFSKANVEFAREAREQHRQKHSLEFWQVTAVKS